MKKAIILTTALIAIAIGGVMITNSVQAVPNPTTDEYGAEPVGSKSKCESDCKTCVSECEHNSECIRTCKFHTFHLCCVKEKGTSSPDFCRCQDLN